MRVLWLKNELLHPVDKGGRIRSFQMLRAIQREHHVTYLTLDDGTATQEAIDQAGEYADEVIRIPFQLTRRGSVPFVAELARNIVSPLPYSLWRYRVPAFEAELVRQMQRPDIDVVVCDFLTQAVNVPQNLAKPVVLFQHNVEAEIWRRHAEIASNTIVRHYFAAQWRRMVRFEQATCRRLHRVIAVSDADAAHFRDRYGVRQVDAVATGVDTEYFKPSGALSSDGSRIVFTGAMDWMPNEDGIDFFAAEVLPLVRKEVPNATLTVVGRNPVPRVRALASAERGIEVTGTVPDVRPYLERAAIFVVPLRIGGGTRLKIYEAMAMERPVVTTTVGAEGLPLTPGEHALFADDPALFAAHCVALLRDPARAAALGRAGGAFVRRTVGWDRVAAQFMTHCVNSLGDPLPGLAAAR
jgi:sugar transferase (PEP-CTERM/EpsH1 system associated)